MGSQWKLCAFLNEPGYPRSQGGVWQENISSLDLGTAGGRTCLFTTGGNDRDNARDLRLQRPDDGGPVGGVFDQLQWNRPLFREGFELTGRAGKIPSASDLMQQELSRAGAPPVLAYDVIGFLEI